jgi:hypothetical protein
MINTGSASCGQAQAQIKLKSLIIISYEGRYL